MAETVSPVMSLDPSVGHVIEHGLDRRSILNPEVQAIVAVAVAFVTMVWMLLHDGARIAAGRAAALLPRCPFTGPISTRPLDAGFFYGDKSCL